MQRLLRQVWVVPLLLIMALGGCSRDEFIGLPAVDGARGWLVLTDVAGGVIFDAEQAARVVQQDDYRLVALPLKPAELGLSAGSVQLGSGRPIPILASFAYEAEAWVERTDIRLEIPFDPLQCTSCLTVHRCETCLVTTQVQGCAPCTGAAPPQPAQVPAQVCPEGWNGVRSEDEFFRCEADRPAGYDVPCADGQRWSIDTAACVDVATCTAPAIDATRQTVYVDPAAALGGDGSAARPLQRFDRELANVDFVFSATEHLDAIRVTQPNVRLLGHGACSVIRPPDATVGIDVRADVQLHGLRIEGGSERAVRVNQTYSATITNSILRASEVVVAGQGQIHLEGSVVVREDNCRQDCTNSAIFMGGGGSITDSEIVGSPGVGGSGDVTIRQSRVLSPLLGERGIEVSGGPVTIDGLVLTGFSLSLRVDQLEAADVRNMVVTGKLAFDGRDTGFDVQFARQEFADTTVLLHRVDILGEASTLSFGGVNAELSDVRVDSGTRAIFFDAKGRAGRMRLERGWIDYQLDGIRADEGEVELLDVSLRRCESCESTGSGLFRGGVTGNADLLTGARISILAKRDRGIAGFETIDVNDLTVRDASITGVTNQTTSGRAGRTIRGARWDIKGRGVGLVVIENADLTDLEVVPPNGSDLTPMCLLSNASPTVERFRLEPSATRSPMVLLDPELRQRPITDIEFRTGRVVGDRLIRASQDCELDSASLEALPAFIDVALD